MAGSGHVSVKAGPWLFCVACEGNKYKLEPAKGPPKGVFRSSLKTFRPTRTLLIRLVLTKFLLSFQKCSQPFSFAFLSSCVCVFFFEGVGWF